jgi:hypothetical protein
MNKINSLVHTKLISHDSKLSNELTIAQLKHEVTNEVHVCSFIY